MPNNPTMFNDTLVNNWIDAGNIPSLVNYLEQIISFSGQINNEIDVFFA